MPVQGIARRARHCNRRIAPDGTEQRIAFNIAVIPADYRIASSCNDNTAGQGTARIDLDLGNIRSRRIHCHNSADRGTGHRKIRSIIQRHSAGQRHAGQRQNVVSGYDDLLSTPGYLYRSGQVHISGYRYIVHTRQTAVDRAALQRRTRHAHSAGHRSSVFQCEAAVGKIS